jgi:hypothetical protein
MQKDLKILILMFITTALIIGCGKDKGSPSASPRPTPPIDCGLNPSHNQENNWIGDLTIHDRGMYERFLKDHLYCATEYVFGAWDCKNYNALYISLHLAKKRSANYRYGSNFSLTLRLLVCPTTQCSLR